VNDAVDSLLTEETEGNEQSLTQEDLRILQRIPDYEEFIVAHLERAAREEKEFFTLQEQLGEALEALESPKSQKGAATSEDSAASSSQQASDESTLSGLDHAHRGMSPAERVVDLLDRLSLAGQPLLERIIQSTDKDLDQLLSELDADEAAEATGIRSIEEAGKRDLVLNPNSLPIDRLLRKSPASPTRALVRGRGRRRAALELENDADDEQKVKEELTQWMERGKKARQQGRQGLLSPAQRKEMARLLEKAEKGENQPLEVSGEEVGLSIDETGPVTVIDMKKMAEITETPPADLSDDNWFTTVPSIGITKPEVHSRTHSIPVAQLHFRSYFPHLLDLQTHFVLHSAYLLGIPVSRPAHLPIQRTLVTVLKSPFVHKKAMENWDRKTYKRGVKVWDCDPAVLSGWLAYLERNSIEGVGIRITRWEWAGMDLLEDTSGVNREMRETVSPELQNVGVDISSLGSSSVPLDNAAA
jgi:ribosomal protein S10